MWKRSKPPCVRIMVEEIPLYRSVIKIILLHTEILQKDYLEKLIGKKSYSGYLKDRYGVDFYETTVLFTHNKHGNFLAQVVFWDVSRDPTYHKLRKEFYKGASGAIIFFNFIEDHSINESLECMEEFLSLTKGKPIVVMGINAVSRSLSEKISLLKRIFNTTYKFSKQSVIEVSYIEGVDEDNKYFLEGVNFIIEKYLNAHMD